MDSRRDFIQGAVALALVSAVSSLPLDGDELFLSRIRERLIQLVSDGYRIKDFVISPGV
jgi:hypothetical protein